MPPAWGSALPSLLCHPPCSEPNLSFANLQVFHEVPALLPALRTLSDILPGGFGKSDGSRRQWLAVISLGGGGNGTDKLFPANLLSYFKIPGWQRKCWMVVRVRKMLSLDRVRPDLSPPQILPSQSRVRNGKTIWVCLDRVLSPETRRPYGRGAAGAAVSQRAWLSFPALVPSREPLVFEDI